METSFFPFPQSPDLTNFTSLLSFSSQTHQGKLMTLKSPSLNLEVLTRMAYFLCNWKIFYFVSSYIVKDILRLFSDAAPT